MEKNGKYKTVKELEVYQLARELSQIAWRVYERLHWQDKKTMGDQFIRATDSVGANIAEGCGRFHYLDKIKFFYNARGSFLESREHWLELLEEREKTDSKEVEQFKERADKLSIKLNNFISAMYKAKGKSNS